MEIAGRFRAVRRKDHAVPDQPPRPLTERGACLDVRIWSRADGAEPLLLVSASRKQGLAVWRNRFRRRVRMALLAALRLAPENTPFGGVVWVRPARGHKRGADIPYAEIEAQLMLALRQWKAR